MKRTAFSLFLSIVFIAQVAAQYGSRYRDDDEPEHRFTVGVAPLSLLLRSGKVNVRGEWAYSRQQIALAAGSSATPNQNPGILARRPGCHGRWGIRLKNRFTQFGLTLENRFYVTHRAPAGFYLAPYLRYNRFGITHTKATSDGYETKIRGTIGGSGFGAAMGAQFRLGKHMTLDVTAAGLDFKWMNGTLFYTSNDPDNDIVAFRNEIQEKVEEIPIIGKALSAQIEDSKVKVRSALGIWPGYRFN